jgi:glycosyltransferase involved in cell wall biosynthesis
LTIGMATYDDYDGVYFTLQSIRLYHPEILDDAEFLVVDNHPDGPCAQVLKALENSIPNYRYVPKNDVSGTAVRDAVFREASGEIVLCIDCHVMIAKGALKRLLDYFDSHPGSRDLLQGPLLFDSMTKIATHFTPKWRAGMYGYWNTAPAVAAGNEAPFEITMQGLGLFACRRDAWPGFNPAFRGFGGEEGYIHEKFRRRGGRTLCLPFLQWMHRFNRPLGHPYANRWEDRIRNYFIGFRELGWDTRPITEHFNAVLGIEPTTRIGEAIERELAVRGIVNANPPPARQPSLASDLAPFQSVWDEVALSQQRRILQRIAAIAGKNDIALYLYWGTLLGHIRERGILQWDDDVDLAMFEPDKAAALCDAFKIEGLETYELRSPTERWIKVYDPAYPVTPHHSLPWTWPNVDIFLYDVDSGFPAGSAPAAQCSCDVILPGRMTTFEGAQLWEPESPLAVLDLQYPEWRYSERSSPYSHRQERVTAGWAARPIATDSHGQKVSQGRPGKLLKTEQPGNPLVQTIFLPLLRAWIALCRDHKVPYSVFWGTLLGQVRNQRLIPYDFDLDVVVGRSGLDILYALPGRVPGCVYNDDLRHQPEWKEHEIRLVVRRDLTSADGPRYDHRGQKVQTQVDSCAFNGPLARLIIKLPAEAGLREFWHVDVDLFTDLSHFDAYPPVPNVDELPDLEERPLEDLLVSCIKNPLPYLTAWYGADYLVADHVYHDGRWLRRR